VVDRANEVLKLTPRHNDDVALRESLRGLLRCEVFPVRVLNIPRVLGREEEEEESALPFERRT